jgi:hypothetical protein
VDDEVALYINGDYVATTVAGPNAEGNATPIFDASVWGTIEPIEPGDEVKVVRQSDDFTKKHIVSGFTNYVNVEDDMVYGKAGSNATMVVAVPFGDDSYLQFVTAEPTGYWSADFESIYPITPDTYGATGQYDDDYDMTILIWSPTETSSLAPVSTLVNIYGGLKEAAEALGFESVKELQEAIRAYYFSE